MLSRPILSAAVLTLVLAACAPPEGPTTAAPASATPPRPATAEAAADCAPIAELFDDLVKRKAAGLTEQQALDELSARGAYTEGYVVDAVFKAAPDTPTAMTKADVLATCRNVKKTGTTY